MFILQTTKMLLAANILKNNTFKNLYQITTSFIHRTNVLNSEPKNKFDKDCETAINCQINKEFSACFFYISLSSAFNCETQPLPGFHKMYSCFAKEEIEHATKLIKYQSMRGGKLQLAQLPPPKEEQWTAASAVEATYELEKAVLDNLNEVVEVGTKAKDHSFVNFVVNEFICQQLKDLKSLSILCTQVKNAGTGPGLNMVDQDLLKKYSKDEKNK